MAEIRPQAADAAAAAGSSRPSRRRLLRIGAWTLVGLLVLAAALIFIAGTTVTLQWAAQQAVRLSDGRLEIENIAGSVLSEIVADSVRWQDNGVGITITSPRFTYHPFALLDGLMRVERISAANVEVELPPPPEPVRPRQPIRLPQAMAALLPVAIERIDAGRVVVRRAGRELLRLHNLEAVLRHDGDRFNASLLNADVVTGADKIGLRGEAAVLSRAPYATDGRLAVKVPMQPEALRIEVRINGPLEELSVRAGTTIGGAPVDARAVLHALDPRPLRQVQIELKDLDLSHYDATLPATRLTGSYDAEILPAWTKGRQPLLIGPLVLANAMAGPIDRGRIPIDAAKAVVGVVDGRVEVLGLQAKGPLGEVTGDGWVGPDSFAVSLGSDKLQLQGIVSTLAPRVLAAKVDIGPVASGAGAESPVVPGSARGGLSLKLVAGDATLAAELTGVLAGTRLQVRHAQVRLKAAGPGGAGRQGGAGQAGFTGSVGLGAPWPVNLSGDFREFDPAQLVTMPPALLNGSWRVAGHVAGDQGGQIDAEVNLADSRLRGLPLAGRLAATLALRDSQPRRVTAVDAALHWGSGTLQAAGALGEPADALRLVMELPKMAQWQEDLDGAVKAKGTLRGPLFAPAVEASIDGRHLTVTAGGVRTTIASAALQLEASNLHSGVLSLQARFDDVDVARAAAAEGDGKVVVTSLLGFDRVTAAVDGSRADHTARLDAVGPGQSITLAMRGSLTGDGTWHGSVRELAASHPLLRMPAGALAWAAAGGSWQDAGARVPRDVESLQPFVLTAGNGRAGLHDGRFDFQGATLSLKQLAWQDSVLTVVADATGVAARWLGRFGNLAALYRFRGDAVATPASAAILAQDLRLAAALDFTGNLAAADLAGWRGALQVKRESGDVSLQGPQGGSADRAGLSTLEAGATLEARVVNLVVHVDGASIGRISGEARTTLQGGSGPAWAEASLARSPLQGRIELATGSFRWISPLVGNSWNVDGALSARLQLAGTLTRPRAEGVVTGNNLSAQEQALGMQLSNGVFAAELDGDRIDVKVLRFESGVGSVAVSGLLQPAGDGRSEARIVIDRLAIPLGAGQRVVLSGSTTATLADRALQVTGRLVADEGVIELRGGDAPAVSGDVMTVDAGGREFAVRDALPEAGPAPGTPQRLASPAICKMGARPSALSIDTDVEMDLGRSFRVFGSGLEARLRGAIRLRGSVAEASPAAGIVELVEGAYQIYGRKLNIRHGRVIFNGPLDNPALDIVAVREHLKIVPGVEIGGTAAAPLVKLISDPEVADAEKLSWLVLGTGLQDAQGAGQLPALQAAAATLFGDENAQYAPGLTDRLGIDLLSVREQDNSTTAGGASDSAQGAVVLVGKRLSSHLFATYEQSLRGVWSILKLQCEITDRLSLSVQAGGDSAVDLPWFSPFD